MSRHSLAAGGFCAGLAVAASGVLLAGAGVAGYSFEIEPRWLALERVRVALPPSARALHGLRIAQLSDLHYGPFTGLSEITRAVDMALALAPDLIVLTGDYVTGQANHATALVPVLKRLSAPLGTFAILGNHDHWTDAAEVAAHLRAAGLRLLNNEAVRFPWKGGGFWLAGVDDVWEQQADLPRALVPVTPGEPVILLAHEPDFADTAAHYGVALQLSGHSHGGQVRLPGMRPPVLPYLARKYPLGLQRVGELWLYTNRGIGTSPPAMRFNCRPEVTLLDLV